MKFSFKERSNARRAELKEMGRRSEFNQFLASGSVPSAEGLSFIGATIRKNRKVDEVFWLCLNIDKFAPDPSVFLESLDCEWYAWSTWNDGNPLVDDQLRHRFTVIIPLRMPVNAHDYQGIVRWVDHQWGIVGRNGGTINKAVRDPGHVYWTPRDRNPESVREPWIYSHFQGVKRLDPYNLPGAGDCRQLVKDIAHEAPRAEFLAKQRERIADPGLTAGQRAYLDDQLREFEVPTERAEAMNVIDSFAIRMGGYLAQYPSAFERATVVNHVVAAAAAVDLEAEDLAVHVENALDFGAKTPIRIPEIERPPLRLVESGAVNTVGRKLKNAPCPEHEIPPTYDIGPGGVWYW